MWAKSFTFLLIIQPTANIFESGPMPNPMKILVLTQLTTWDDSQAVQKFSWGWHWSTFKDIGC